MLAHGAHSAPSSLRIFTPFIFAQSLRSLLLRTIVLRFIRCTHSLLVRKLTICSLTMFALIVRSLTNSLHSLFARLFALFAALSNAMSLRSYLRSLCSLRTNRYAHSLLALRSAHRYVHRALRLLIFVRYAHYSYVHSLRSLSYSCSLY
jgi:hypothetical protein